MNVLRSHATLATDRHGKDSFVRVELLTGDVAPNFTEPTYRVMVANTEVRLSASEAMQLHYLVGLCLKR